MIKAIIFDFFGVIYPDLSFRWLDEAVQDRNKIEQEYKEICRKNDLGLLNNGRLYDELSRITNIPREEVRQGIKRQMVLDEELVDYIKSMEHDYKLSILSNCGTDFVESILDKEGIDDLFDDVVISADVGMIKPDPKIFELALTRLDVNPAEVIFVDDSLRNIESSRALGINSLLFTDTQSLVRYISELDKR